MFAITDVSGTQLPVLVTHNLLLTEAHKYLSAQFLLTDVFNSWRRTHNYYDLTPVRKVYWYINLLTKVCLLLQKYCTD